MLRQQKHKAAKKDQLTQTIYETVDVDTQQCFETPYRKSAQICLSNNVAAVIFYVKPEYTGRGWREGTISIAVVKKDLLLIVDAINALEYQIGVKEIAIIGIEGDLEIIDDIKNFICSNSSRHQKFEIYHQQLANRDLNPIINVHEKQTVNVGFEEATLVIKNVLPTTSLIVNKNRFLFGKLCFLFHKPVGYHIADHKHDSSNTSAKQLK